MKSFILWSTMCCSFAFALVLVPAQTAVSQCVSCGDVVAGGCAGCSSCADYYPFKGHASYRPDLVTHPTCDGSPLLLRRCTGFHGKYYGRPYNYRNLLDYPWHEPLRLSRAPHAFHNRIKTVPNSTGPNPTGPNSPVPIESVPQGVPQMQPPPPIAPTSHISGSSWVQTSDLQADRLQSVEDKPALRFRIPPKSID